MEIEVKVISKNKIILENLDDSYVGETKKCLLYFEDASFRFQDPKSPLKKCNLFYKDIELEILKKQNRVLIFTVSKLEDGSFLKELALEIMPSEKYQKKIFHLFQSKKRLTTFKTPLSYSPARLERPSLLSTESPSQNYRGFINLAIIVLIVTNFRLVMENFLKYGWLIKWVNPLTFATDFKNFPCLSATFALGIFILIAYYIEKSSLEKKITEKKRNLLNVINIVVCLVSPSILIYLVHPLPIPALILLMIDLIIAFKLISFAHVLSNVREILEKIKLLQAEKKDISVNIRDSDLDSANREYLLKNLQNPTRIISLPKLMYFVAAPTLCFQLVYPRTQKIRKIWVLKRVVELIVVLSVMSFIIQQYIVPIVENTVPFMIEKNYGVLFERLLKLSLPNLYVWICMFLSLFHLFFNITAELLRFADRQFYLDWWNCHNMSDYWKLWNLPMRNFFIRHIYNPLLRKGYSKTFSLFFVFFVSAIGHEYLVSVSIGVLSFWAFLAMLAQVPTILFQTYFEKYITKSPNLGNVMFWISFCFIGQPICVLIYYYLYLIKYGAGTI